MLYLHQQNLNGATSLFSFAGKHPDNLGVKNRQLLACPNTPNCVSSQSIDPKSQILPLSYTAPQQAIARLKAVVEAQPRTKIITAEGNFSMPNLRQR
ncbi:DUF1499 domain-containing protein [Microcoleus sp. FACHB-1515]|uniref:DUF1499 domain-containing protein n=1 Tax=Microcoleus sp. FACHB-1515 TaxID=2692821 RepID=UPI0028C389B5|nr:DUF1499 domain-containing protein [Microcoleus sp. FACHB-1515]